MNWLKQLINDVAGFAVFETESLRFLRARTDTYGEMKLSPLAASLVDALKDSAQWEPCGRVSSSDFWRHVKGGLEIRHRASLGFLSEAIEIWKPGIFEFTPRENGALLEAFKEMIARRIEAASRANAGMVTAEGPASGLPE